MCYASAGLADMQASSHPQPSLNLKISPLHQQSLSNLDLAFVSFQPRHKGALLGASSPSRQILLDSGSQSLPSNSEEVSDFEIMGLPFLLDPESPPQFSFPPTYETSFMQTQFSQVMILQGPSWNQLMMWPMLYCI